MSTTSFLKFTQYLLLMCLMLYATNAHKMNDNHNAEDNKQLDKSNTEDKNNNALVVNSENAHKFELHVFYDFLKKNQVASPNCTVTDGSTYEQVLEDILMETLQNDPSAVHLLKQFANSTQNATVVYTVYKVIWQDLQTRQSFYNPHEIILLYKDYRSNLYGENNNNTYSDSNANNTTDVNEKALEMENDIRLAIITRSAQLLEGYIYARIQNSTLESHVYTDLLGRLNTLNYGIFNETIAKALDAATIMVPTMTDIVKAIGTLSTIMQQNVIANLVLYNRIQLNAEQYATENAILLNNFLTLQKHSNFSALPHGLQNEVNNLIPVSLRVLNEANRIAIKNATHPDEYISECPSSYRMCAVTKDLIAKAHFTVNRKQNQLYTFYSTYWSNRTITLQSNTTSTDVIVNVYSSSSTVGNSWFVMPVNNLAAIMDSTQTYYVCSGHRSYLDNANRLVYTRKAVKKPLTTHANECLWEIVDTSV